MIKLDTIVRLATIDDDAFIISKWVKSIQNIYPNHYDKEFNTKYRKHVKQLFEKSLAVVSCLEDDHDCIISYMVFTSFNKDLIIHFAYTKPDARRQGKVNDLISYSNPENKLTIFTHPAHNQNVMKYLMSKYVYDPSILKLI